MDEDIKRYVDLKINLALLEIGNSLINQFEAHCDKVNKDYDATNNPYFRSDLIAEAGAILKVVEMVTNAITDNVSR